MRSLSDTGADKVKGPGLHEHIGAVLVIERKPSIEEAPEFPGHYKAHIIATDEATGAQREYLSGAARLIGQASMIQASWNGDPVRVKVAGRLNKWGNPSVWFEEAPAPHKAPDTTPIPEEVREKSRAEEAARAQHYTTGQWHKARKMHSDPMGVTNWNALAEYILQGSTPAEASA